MERSVIVSLLGSTFGFKSGLVPGELGARLSFGECLGEGWGFVGWGMVDREVDKREVFLL